MNNARAVIPYAVATLWIVAEYLTFLYASGHPANAEQVLERAGTWVGAVVVVWAAYIAVQQLKDARRAARATTFLEVMQRYQSEKMQTARKDIFHLISTDDPRGSRLTVCRFYEEVGTLVRFHGLEFEVVNSYLNTRIIKAYRRLNWFIAERRRGDERRDPDPYAWKYFEWLALKCIAHGPRPDPKWTRLRQDNKDRIDDTMLKPADALDGTPAPAAATRPDDVVITVVVRSGDRQGREVTLSAPRP